MLAIRAIRDDLLKGQSGHYRTTQHHDHTYIYTQDDMIIVPIRTTILFNADDPSKDPSSRKGHRSAVINLP